jgi:hypothetical protein
MDIRKTVDERLDINRNFFLRRTAGYSFLDCKKL